MPRNGNGTMGTNMNGAGSAIVPGTNFFTPNGAIGYYNLGTNRGFLRGTNGFFRPATNGMPGQFIPDGGQLYERGPDGMYHHYNQDDTRGIYRNGVLYPDTNAMTPPNSQQFNVVR